MNYVELHIGDYDKDTAHLSACEDGIYGRLLRRYYNTEEPLPLDLKAVQRLVRAHSREERQAVETVLGEFFQRAGDGWRHGRCDQEIAKYRESQVEVDERRNHEAERKRRYRQRRAELFEQLRERGLVPKFDTPMEELERLLSRGTGRGQDEGRPRAGTAIHTPDSSIPVDTTRQAPENSNARAPAAAGEACRAMREAGCPLQGMNPSHPELLAALDAGVTPQALADTVREALASTPPKSKPFTWAIATAHGRHLQPPKPHAAGPPRAAQPSKTRAAAETLLRGTSYAELPADVAERRDPLGAGQALEPAP